MSKLSFDQLPRNERRLLLRREEKARQAGVWKPWEHLPIPPGSVGRGWAAEFNTAHKNDVFCVLERLMPDGTKHLMISSLSEDRPSWHEAQRIKNEIAGPDATAVEIYPPHAEVVDDANAYHLWVLPAPFPHTLARRAA